jgi:hypothetical protein
VVALGGGRNSVAPGEGEGQKAPAHSLETE